MYHVHQISLCILYATLFDLDCFGIMGDKDRTLGVRCKV